MRDTDTATINLGKDFGQISGQAGTLDYMGLTFLQTLLQLEALRLNSAKDAEGVAAEETSRAAALFAHCIGRDLTAAGYESITAKYTGQVGQIQQTPPTWQEICREAADPFTDPRRRDR